MSFNQVRTYDDDRKVIGHSEFSDLLDVPLTENDVEWLVNHDGIEVNTIGQIRRESAEEFAESDTPLKHKFLVRKAKAMTDQAWKTGAIKHRGWITFGHRNERRWSKCTGMVTAFMIRESLSEYAEFDPMAVISMLSDGSGKIHDMEFKTA